MTYNTSVTDALDGRLPHDGVKAFILDFTTSAAKIETSVSHMKIAPAAREFLKAASFLVRN